MTTASPDPDPPEGGTLERVRLLLVEALEILDSRCAPPEIGARLQGVIENVQDYSLRTRTV